jgi:hypothetical protein
MYGITFGNEKVQKWITSLLFSVICSIFLTQPIQVIITTIFPVSVLRRKTELGQEKMKEDQKFDASATVNDHLDYIEKLRPECQNALGSIENHDQSRNNSVRERKIRDILKKLVLHALFMTALFIVSYSSRNNNTFPYQNLLTRILVNDKPLNDQAVMFKNVIYLLFLLLLGD